MKKAIFESYGGLDTIKIVASKIPPLSAREVLVKVEAVGLNPKDVLVRKGKFKQLTGKKFPQTIGFEFSGIIEDPHHSSFAKGESVFGMVNGWQGRCCAEFLNIRTDEISRAPENLSYEELAGIALAGQTALQAIRDIGGIQKNQKICINGASGGVGTLAIQIAKALGGIVTTISSKKNMDFCCSFGADRTVAYDETDILKSGEQFDLFFDVFGNYSFRETSPIIAVSGKYITTVPKLAIFKEQLFNLFRKKKAKMIVVKSKAKDLQWLSDQLASNNIRPVVDKIFPWSKLSWLRNTLNRKEPKVK